MTGTGINVKGILARLILEKRRLGFRNRPAISDEEGKLFTVREIDDMLLEVLKDCYLENRELFPLDVTSAESLDQFTIVFDYSGELLPPEPLTKQSLQLMLI